MRRPLALDASLGQADHLKLHNLLKKAFLW
jgi:hypothetical protein